jgi:superfamily II DNA or RNA helicase
MKELMGTSFVAGLTVRARGERFTVIDVDPLPSSGSDPVSRLRLRGLEGDFRGAELTVLYPIEPVEPDYVPDLSLERVGRIARFRLLHDVFRLKLAPPPEVLIGAGRSRIRLESYQYIPAARALQLPRPRLLLADDVGLGKTVEAGLILQELSARRRANRVLVVCPAGIMNQWRQELERRFSFKFAIFDSDSIHERRKELEIGSNPWAVESRVIASMDFVKRREGAFRDLSSTKWDVVIVDEAHHLAAGRNADDVTDRHRLGRWLAEATDALLLLTATPHDGYDEGFASLLALLEPSLVAPDGTLRFDRYQRHLVRRLKRHIVNDDGTPKFLERRVNGIPVRLNAAELDLNESVMSQVRDLETLAGQARRPLDSEAIRLVATILRKRAASSQHALANTLQQRRSNLDERIEELEIQRDYVRALRRGDTVPDGAIARLEQDAHRNYLAVVRRLGTQVRRAEEEVSAVEDLQQRLGHCRQLPESKMAALLQELRDVVRENGTDKVIVFSEYADTVIAIQAALNAEQGYADKVCALTGDLSPNQRESVLDEFAGPNKLVLVATDAAGEGLNLQEHCHRIIHFELPWNPNRLEQRNGRVDRYGQGRTPLISFLYSRDTYEGEVLAKLVDKIERQMSRLGSVGDVLGQLQIDRIDAILARTPDDIPAAVRAAEQEIESEINRITERPLSVFLGNGTVDPVELEGAKTAARKGTVEDVNTADFVKRAVEAAGGDVEQNGLIRVGTPASWVTSSVRSRYESLSAPTHEDAPSGDPENFLDGSHPLTSAAIRWVKSRRFDPQDDHRLAYVLTTQIDHDDLIATYVIRLRDGLAQEIERLEAIRVTPDLQVSQEFHTDLAALMTLSEGNLPGGTVSERFGSWWERARALASAEAQRRANEWRHAIQVDRNRSQHDLMRELEDWNRASRRAILGEQAGLFGEANLPPSLRRKLRQHDERYRERLEHLNGRLEFTDPFVEPLGVLLRVPAGTEGRRK